jgi:pyruvate kinase
LPGGRKVAHLRRTAYVIPGTRIEVRRGHHHLGSFELRDAPVRATRWHLKAGDRLRLQDAAGQGGALSERMQCIGCSLPQALSRLLPGQRVIFDDGKIECVAEQRTPQGVILKVQRAPRGGANLKAEKGINLPDTDLSGLEFGADDERALTFALAAADMLGVSFVREPANVSAIQERVASRGRSGFGIVLKIETATAFANLPAILLAAMAHYPVGIMIARGDLAIEVGFERLAEVQEEILWLCEAAHLPVIWATEVLAQLAQEGLATRAEVTDAAMSVRAECVMLNKGPQIDVAVTTLVDILQRMERHQYKKRSLYRKLSLSLPQLQDEA